MQWQQANLPIKASGLGIRNVKSIASPAFLAYVSKTKQLQNCLLYRCSNVFSDHHYDLHLDNWRKNNQPIQPPVGILSTKQKSLDKPVTGKLCSILHVSQPDEHNRARLLTASAAHSGDWLQALLISSCGLRLDNEAVRVAIGLRLGTNLRVQRRCPFGAEVDCRGTHGLPCKRSSARIARYNYINDIIHRALVRAKIASVKEPDVFLVLMDSVQMDCF